MKNITQPQPKAELLQRIAALTPQHTRQWGTLSIEGMLAHCTDQLRIATHEKTLNPMPFPMGIVGRIIKYPMMWGVPMGKNSPTAPELDQNQGGTKPQTLDAEKQIIAQKIDQFLQQPDTTTAHPFFGKLNKNDWARLSYVHIDYHLKQFGA